jgi:hypothetical protein
MGVSARRQRSRDRRIDTGSAGRMRSAVRTRVPAGVDGAVAKADELVEVLGRGQLRQAEKYRASQTDLLQTHYPTRR